MLTLPSSETVLGELVDLSVVGAGVLLEVGPTRLPRGTRVAVLIEANDLPDPEKQGTVISVRALVASVALNARTTGNVGHVRFGLEFAQEPAGLAARLAGRESSGPAAGTGSSAAVAKPGQALAATPQGREILFQHACACLATNDPASAVAAMTWALEKAPGNVAYRLLRHRAAAEAALARGDAAEAAIEAHEAHKLAPGVAEVGALRARVADRVSARGLADSDLRPTRKGIFGRLFAR